jgi:TonB family protein
VTLRLGPPGAGLPRDQASAAVGRSGSVPQFAIMAVRRIAAAITFREAVLTSLLAHAIGMIVIIMAPSDGFGTGFFAADPAQAFPVAAEEQPIEMAFIQDIPRPPEPNPEARMASDRDRRRAQPEQPPDPQTMQPFSQGNTEAMIAEGPISQPAPPQPPPDPSTESTEPEAESERQTDGSQESDPLARIADETLKSIEAPEGPGPFYVPPSLTLRRDAADESFDKGQQLSDALARMGASNSLASANGSQFKFDNPVGGLSTPTGNLSFDTQGFDWGDYARKIYWIIWTNWHSRMPPAIHTGQKGVVTVRFVIERDGTLSEIKILQPSGIPAYDSAAGLALEASNPLPPLPENFPKQREGVTGRFLYNMWRQGR